MANGNNLQNRETVWKRTAQKRWNIQKIQMESLMLDLTKNKYINNKAERFKQGVLMHI
jgi:hypothetical protein